MTARMIRANCAARVVVSAFAVLLWLMIAAEARAEDGFGSSGDGATAINPMSGDGLGDEQNSAGGAPTDPVLEGTTPLEDPVETPPVQPPVEEAPSEVLPSPEPPQAESPPAQPPVPEQPPAQPPVLEQPALDPPAPVAEAPSREPPPAPDLPVLGPSLIPEAPVLPSPSGDLVEALPVSNAEVPASVQPAAVSRRGSIVAIHPDAFQPSLPSLFPTQLGGEVAHLTLATDRLHVHSGARSETGNEGPPATKSIGDAPLLPPLTLREGGPSTLYVGGGGASGGSSSGFFAWVLAGLLALFWAAQRLSGVIPLTLAPPRCASFAVSLERPD